MKQIKYMEQDLTQGSIARKMLFFSIPLILTNMLQVLFHMADVAVVGQFAGAMALGSVGSTATLINIYTGFLIGMAGGINVLTALYLGAKNKKSLRETVHTSFLISLVIGICILIFGVFTARGIMQLLHTKEELMEGAVLYVRIYVLGMPALSVYNFGNAVFSAAGDTKKPLYFLAAAGILNVILNLFFVIVCGMDVAGVALASIISQYISAGLITAALFRSREDISLRFAEMRIAPDKAKDILKLGIPSGMQNAIFHIANLFIQSAVNSFSAIMVAGNAAAQNADALVYDVMAAFYTACGSFIGQNYGAGKKDRILKSYLISIVYSVGVGAAMGVTLVSFGPQFLALFTKDPAVIEAGMKRLTIMGLSYGVSGFMDSALTASRALGKSVIPTVIVIMGSCVFRIIWVNTIFAYFHTIPSLYLLYVFSWSLTALAEIVYFVRVYRSVTAKM